MQQFAEIQSELRGTPLADISTPTLRRAKESGFSDRRIAHLTASTSEEVRGRRVQVRVVRASAPPPEPVMFPALPVPRLE